MILEIPDTAVFLSDEERASIASIASSPLRPCPKKVTYIRSFVNSMERGLIGLLQAEWPTTVIGSGYNTILVAPKSIVKTHIEIHTKLQYQSLLGSYLPAVRCEGGVENLGSLLFSWPTTHPQGEEALNAPTLSDLLCKPVRLTRLKNALLDVLNVLNDWRKQATLQRVGIGEFFEGHSATLNPPITARASEIVFDIPALPPLPNPLLFAETDATSRYGTLNAYKGRIHGHITSDRIILATPPIFLDWLSTREGAPQALDFARLELELILALMPPEHIEIWKYEWPSLVTALRLPSEEPTSVDGLLASTVWNLVTSVRQSFGMHTSADRKVEYLFACVRAGLDVICGGSTTGARRYAAALYSALALDCAFDHLGLRTTPSSVTNTVYWPGFRAWDGLPKSMKPSGRALLLGAGTFPDDGSIVQLPQVPADLLELASLLERRGYEVHILCDSDFTKERFEIEVAALKERYDTAALPLIVCFCGHGVPHHGSYYLVTGDSTSDNLLKKALEYKQWLKSVSSIGTERLVVLINSCYSGQQLGVPVNLHLSPPGTYVLLSSASDAEQSYMLRDDPVSLFIGVVLEALALPSGDGSIQATLFAFLKYVQEQVPLRASKIGQQQHPKFVLMNVYDDFKLL